MKYYKDRTNYHEMVIRLVSPRLHALNQSFATFSVLLFRHILQKSITGPGHNAFDDLSYLGINSRVCHILVNVN